MMKVKKYSRIIALLLAVVTVFTVPVSAEESNGLQFINLLDYSFPNSYNSTEVSESPVTFSLPQYCHELTYIDMLVHSNKSPVFTVNGSTLTTDYIGSFLYRVYGSISVFYATELIVSFSGTDYVDFYQVLVCPSSAHRTFTSSCDISLKFFDFEQHGLFTGDVVTVTQKVTSAQSFLSPATYNINLNDWRKYDYIDVAFSCYSSALNSISVNLNDIAVPFDLTYVNLNMTSPEIISSEGTGSSGYYFDVIYDTSFVNVQMRIDLRHIDRTLSGVPQIVIDASAERETNLTLGYRL